MSGKRVAAITKRLLEQFRRDRRTLALLFVAPIVILGLLGYLIRGSASAPAVGIANEDQGPLGTTVAAALAMSSGITTTTIQASEGDAKLKDGSLVAYIVLPPDFSSQARAGTIAPAVHFEGSQPGTIAPVLQALQQALIAIASAAPGQGVHVQPQVTYLYGGQGFDTLDYFGAAFIGLVVFFLVFVVTIVSFLNERSQGTLERLMASPLRRGEIVVGYMLGFTVLALIQSVEVLVFSLAILKVHNSGNVALIFGIEALMAIAAVNLGIFLSMFARTEFQAVQFIPLVIVPQFLLSGILFSVNSEPRPLQVLSDVLPLTYAVNGLRDVMIKGADLTWSSLQLDVGVVAGYLVLLVVAAVATLRRRIA
ncbi:MAG TPA: ABC transporter permease [Candidatus Dormibacteraeota bacterium]|jgi:ABC-2 type transport system permease protein|nr:ABC transporter permease [Candidatus Dormibacteraeota bacterium]